MIRCANLATALCLFLWPAGSNGDAQDRSCGGPYQVIFAIDGSQGVTSTEFSQQKIRIKDCACGRNPDTGPTVPIDGSLAIGVIQFNYDDDEQTVQREIPFTVIREDNIQTICGAIENIGRLNPITQPNWKSAFIEAYNMFDEAGECSASGRLVILQADGPPLMPGGGSTGDPIAPDHACDASNSLKDMGVTVCTHDFDDIFLHRQENAPFFRQIANTVDSLTYNPTQPAGSYSSGTSFSWCADCLCDMLKRHTADANADCLPDECMMEKWTLEPEPQWACCNRSDGTCTNETRADCSSTDGVFRPGKTCVSRYCAGDPFLSCNVDGDCHTCYPPPADTCGHVLCPGGSCSDVDLLCHGGDNDGYPCGCTFGRECRDLEPCIIDPLDPCAVYACCKDNTGDCATGFCNGDSSEPCNESTDCGVCDGGAGDGQQCLIGSDDCPAASCVNDVCEDGTRVDQPCASDDDCPVACLSGDSCEPIDPLGGIDCPAGWEGLGLGYGIGCEVNRCAVTSTGGDSCDTVDLHMISIPPAEGDEVTVTITGDTSDATFGDYPATYDLFPFDTGELGWWEGFELVGDTCAFVKIDFCGSPGDDPVRPVYAGLVKGSTSEPCDTVIRPVGIDSPLGEGPDEPGIGRCDDGNIWMTFGPLPAGEYYYPIYTVPGGSTGVPPGGSYQMHVSVLGCLRAACCLGTFHCAYSDGSDWVVGEACDPNAACGSDSYCDISFGEWMCDRGATKGERCNRDYGCGVCDVDIETATCVNGPNDGDPCNPDIDCPGNGRCPVPACVGGDNHGLLCDSDADCVPPDGHCGVGICKGGGKDGEPCDPDFECEGGMCLDGTCYRAEHVPGTARPPCDPDEDCSDGGVCVVGFCVDGDNDGLRCNPHSECLADPDCNCTDCVVLNELECQAGSGYWLYDSHIPEQSRIQSCSADVCDTGACCFSICPAGNCVDGQCVGGPKDELGCNEGSPSAGKCRDYEE